MVWLSQCKWSNPDGYGKNWLELNHRKTQQSTYLSEWTLCHQWQDFPLNCYLKVDIYYRVLSAHCSGTGNATFFGLWEFWVLNDDKSTHDDVIKWKRFPRYWPFVQGIHWSPVNSPHKDQWRGALMFSLIYAWMDGWVNNCEAGDLRRNPAHYDVTVMICSGNGLVSWQRAIIWANVNPDHCCHMVLNALK